MVFTQADLESLTETPQRDTRAEELLNDSSDIDATVVVSEEALSFLNEASPAVSPKIVAQKAPPEVAPLIVDREPIAPPPKVTDTLELSGEPEVFIPQEENFVDEDQIDWIEETPSSPNDSTEHMSLQDESDNRSEEYDVNATQGLYGWDNTYDDLISSAEEQVDEESYNLQPDTHVQLDNPFQETSQSPIDTQEQDFEEIIYKGSTHDGLSAKINSERINVEQDLDVNATVMLQGEDLERASESVYKHARYSADDYYNPEPEVASILTSLLLFLSPILGFTLVLFGASHYLRQDGFAPNIVKNYLTYNMSTPPPRDFYLDNLRFNHLSNEDTAYEIRTDVINTSSVAETLATYQGVLYDSSGNVIFRKEIGGLEGIQRTLNSPSQKETDKESGKSVSQSQREVELAIPLTKEEATKARYYTARVLSVKR